MDLADREAGPEPYRLDYGPAGDNPSLALYEADWYLWRAIHRDSLLTEAEWNVRIDAYSWALDRLPRSNVAPHVRRWTG
jgi:hypothetical protein